MNTKSTTTTILVRMIATAGLAAFALSGCYTQVLVVDTPGNPGTPATDSLARRVDPIQVRDREVCYWTRDYFGRYVLRCDPTYYSRDWYLYNYASWWDRYDPYSYDYDRCPRFYYYDPSSGSCRYYTDRPYYYGGGGSGGTSGGGSAPSPRSRSYGVPPSSATPLPPSRSTRDEVSAGSVNPPVGESNHPESVNPRTGRSRSAGVPSSGTATPAPAPQREPPAQASQPAPAAESAREAVAPSPASGDSSSHPRRGRPNARSW